MRCEGSLGRFLVVLAGGAALTVSSTAPLEASAPVVAPRAHYAASTRRLPDFGNPAGHAHVPPAGGAVGTDHPDHVIGTGTPASCSSAAVVRAAAGGGVITFNCGPGPVTITMTATAKVVNTSHRIVLDGGGTVTLSGAGERQILYMNTCDRRQQWTTSDCYDQEWPGLVVENMTFEDGNTTVSQSKGTSFGGGGGGAIFDLESSTLRDNPSAGFWTRPYPGVFFQSSGHPKVVGSTIS